MIDRNTRTAARTTVLSPAFRKVSDEMNRQALIEPAKYERASQLIRSIRHEPISGNWVPTGSDSPHPQCTAGAETGSFDLT